MEALPSKETAFNFEHIGESGKRYDGTFTVRCVLNVGQKHQMALEKTRLLGNYPNPTDDLAGWAVVLANLRAKVIDGPSWWTQSGGGNLIEDEDAVVMLYNKVQEAELRWKEDLKKKAQTAQETSSQLPTP